ncbi:cytochrome P450 [Streptomyces ziwulingensis]|uniref:Cytochrome P450 n=1 Tax=Streptomyces ziwulingensis TaxID=1045501 RepID=A0ABP9B5M2_9ACTN
MPQQTREQVPQQPPRAQAYPELLYTRRTRFDPADDLRAAPPLSRYVIGPNESDEWVWLATGYAEVRRILGDHTNFSTRRRWGAAGPDWRPPELVGHLMDYDPPEHTRLRQMLTPEFTVRRLRRLEPDLEAIIEEHLDAVEAAGPGADLMPLFAQPVPGEVLCELIGVARDDRPEFLRHCHRHLDFSRSRKVRAADGAAFSRYLVSMVARQREDPDEGFIGSLVREHGDRFTDDEMRGVCVLLILAGIDNIEGMIGLGVLAMLEHPEQLPLLLGSRDADGDGTGTGTGTGRGNGGGGGGRLGSDRALDELIRYMSVANAPTPRTAVHDVTIGDQVIKAGETVICSLTMANRDPSLTDGPDRLDLAREPVAHVAFGHGVHHCLGAALARTELRIAYRALWRRFPGLRLAVPLEEVRFYNRALAHGVHRLPVTW